MSINEQGHAGCKKGCYKARISTCYDIWKLESDYGNQRINSFYMRGAQRFRQTLRFAEKGERGVIASEFKSEIRVLNFLRLFFLLGL